MSAPGHASAGHTRSERARPPLVRSPAPASVADGSEPTGNGSRAATRRASPVQELPPWLRRLRRVLGHEWSVAVLGAILIALYLNRGALADPAHTLPRDIWDPSLVAYLIAWGGYALLHDPGGIWDLNAFYPAPYGLAYSDAMLGYAPFAIVGTGPEAAVLRYNLLFIAAHALVLFGGYALARQLGLRPAAAALVGVALAVAPWRLSQTGHLQIVSSGGMFLALAMLARGYGIRWLRRPGPRHQQLPQRPGWVYAGWLVATWQVTIGFGLGLPFLYVLLGCFVAGTLGWAYRRRDQLRTRAWTRALPPWPLLVATGVGGAVFATVSLLLARPYLRVLELYPYARRSVAWIDLYSPPMSGLFTAPQESTVWGEAHAAAREALPIPVEMALLPGFALYALAAAGLFVSVWPLRVRLGLGFGAAGFATLSLGTHGPADGEWGYLLLLHLPGFEGIRTPGRLIVWATLLLGLLAAGAVGAMAVPGSAAPVPSHARSGRHESMGRAAWPGPRSTGAASALVHLALVVPTLVVFLEGRGSLPHPTVPPAPPALATVEAPFLVLPTHEVMDMNVMLWSTDRFADTVNGASGFVPAELRQLREAVATFPDQASVAYLRAVGVRSVVVLPYRLGGTPLADAASLPIDGLGLTRQVQADAVVFTISP